MIVSENVLKNRVTRHGNSRRRFHASTYPINMPMVLIGFVGIGFMTCHRPSWRSFCFDVWAGSHMRRLLNNEPDISSVRTCPQQSRLAPAWRLCFCRIAATRAHCQSTIFHAKRLRPPSGIFRFVRLLRRRARSDGDLIRKSSSCLPDLS